jgi:hypothetical protein
MANCEICGTPLAHANAATDKAVGRSCPRCGEFCIDIGSSGLIADANWFPGNENKEKMVRVSGWTREQNVAGSVPIFTDELVARVAMLPRPEIRSRSMTLLRELSLDDPNFNRTFSKMDLSNSRILGATYSFDSNDLDVLLRVLEREGLIDMRPSRIAFGVSTQGILELERITAPGGGLTQGFVAMWFDPAFDPVWINGFDPAIRGAGYKPFRIDKKHYIGGITDEIIAEIRRSRFVVVDYTQQVNGVYFEAGFALGLGLPVIPTCRDDQIGKLHFDIRHLNTLSWKEPKDLAENLATRIVAVVGAGPFTNK